MNHTRYLGVEQPPSNHMSHAPGLAPHLEWLATPYFILFYFLKKLNYIYIRTTSGF